MKPDVYPKGLPGGVPEDRLERLAAYGFARRYVEGKTVALVDEYDVGRGVLVLGDVVDSIVGFTLSRRAADYASSLYPAPNAGYEAVAEFPKLPRPDDSLDCIVAAPGVILNPADVDTFLREAQRLLKRSGVLILSVPNAKVDETRGLSGMYAAELGDLLGRYFPNVLLYETGAVSGGVVFPVEKPGDKATLRGAHFALSDPDPGPGMPAVRSFLAVCSDGENSSERGAYLLLDQDHQVFEEREDLREDVDLLRGEVLRMQESEAQAFQDTLKLRNSEVNHFKNRLDQAESRFRELVDQNEKLKRQKQAAEKHGQDLERRRQALEKQLRNIENSRTWRLLGLYRKLRTGKR